MVTIATAYRIFEFLLLMTEALFEEWLSKKRKVAEMSLVTAQRRWSRHHSGMRITPAGYQPEGGREGGRVAGKGGGGER